MKTYSTKPVDIEPKWHVIDAEGKALGRLCTEVATLLMGKHKPIYVPHLNTGDYVVVLNAAKVKLTGNKEKQKVYYRHSNYPSGLTAVNYVDMMKTYPNRIIEFAVKGMLPHNRLGRQMLKRLKVYAGDVHPHQAQVGKSEEGGIGER